jgi:hypothetical protein
MILASLVFSTIGSHLWVKWRQVQIKREVKRMMMHQTPDSQLVTMTFSREESRTRLNWKHSREFELNGEWYDIVRTEERGDSVTYHLWHDKEETALCRQLNRVVSFALQNHPKNNQPKERIAGFFRNLIQWEQFGFEPEYAFPGHLRHQSARLQLVFCSGYEQLLSPPPDRD